VLSSIAIYNRAGVHVLLILTHKQLFLLVRVDIALQAVLDQKLRLPPLCLLDLVVQVQRPLGQLDVPPLFDLLLGVVIQHRRRGVVHRA
jgi:hypothetical protein